MKAPIQLTLLLVGSMTIIAVSGCSVANNDGSEKRDALLADPSAAPVRSVKDYSVEDIYSECNKTFAISMDYLNEMNDTGSFPDETDKTPMCFIRCFLQKGGIVTVEDKVNKEQAISLGWVKDGETIDDCLQEMTGNPCERAYFLMRCVSTRHLVEGRSKDNRKR